MEIEKDWALFILTVFCAMLSEVPGDLLFAAQITASTSFLLYGVRSTAST
jgi:hypothetical protein